MENINFLDVYQAVEDPIAAKRVEQADERERIRTGRLTPELPKTASEFRRQEFGLPVALAAAGISVSTLASLLSLLVV